MGIKITYHQIYVSDHGVDGSSVVVPNVNIEHCSVVGADFVGGGADKRFLLHIVALENSDDSK